MMLTIGLSIWLIMMINSRGSAISYNQPKFCPSAVWQPNATTFANSSTIGQNPFEVFVNTYNTVHVTNQANGQIFIWGNGSYNNLTILNGFNFTYSLFVTSNNNIYVNGGWFGGNITEWIWNMNTSVFIMNVQSTCYGLFVDINHFLYCSVSSVHTVIKKSLSNNTSTIETAAGTYCPGVTSNMLYKPQGIFVHTNLSLYVADCGNDRIQLFQNGTLNGITIAGNGAPNTITLNCPTAIVLDGDAYLYIVDQDNNRIIGSGSNGYRCIVGCSGSGSTSSQLNSPQSMAFDSYGNIFVTDRNNGRIQKFFLETYLCANTVTSTNTMGLQVTSTSSNANAFHSVSTLLNTRVFQETSTSLAITTASLNTMASTATMMENDSSYSITETINNAPIIQSFDAISYNQPVLESMASWRVDAVTFVDSTTIGYSPMSIFINVNDSLYVGGNNNLIQMQLEANMTSIALISSNLSNPYGLFVSSNDDIYIGNTYPYNHVDQWTLNATMNILQISIGESCWGIFVDINNVLYCSIGVLNQVIKKSLNNEQSPLILAVGTGCAGGNQYELSNPHGIFVDINFDLYVADCGNNRIQYFHSGQSNGTAKAGSGATNTITLNCPTGVTLDAHSYLFIVDSGNNRIIGSGPNGFRCVAGCFGQGSAPSQLNKPQSMAFDSYGNIFVVDTNNNRIQKFVKIPNLCDATTTSTIGAVVTSTGAVPLMNSTFSFISSSVTSGTQSPQVVSYNQPELNPLATWSVNGFTFASSNTIGSYPYGIFVNTNNTIYVADRQNGGVHFWSETNSTIPPNTISANLSSPHSIFVTSTNNIYIDNGYDDGQVDKLSFSTTATIPAMMVKQECYGLFVDVSSTLYCSIVDLHQVVAKSLTSAFNTSVIVAGTQCSGSTPYMLYYPCGIFVDINFDLYVADCGNNRIQRFQSGQYDATTVAGNGKSGTFTLSCPTGVVLDVNKYLFIVDSNNHRILGSGPNGFRCIVGCFNSGSSGSSQLYYPQSMAFDSQGNFFVTDMENSRVQKFVLLNDSSIPSYNQPKFCPMVNWDPNAITLENNISNLLPYGIYINTNNTVYVADSRTNQILIWFDESTNLSSTLSGINSLSAVFVTTTGDIYIGGNNGNDAVNKWTSNLTTSILVMSSPSNCVSLFIDVANTLYCSNPSSNQVFKKWLNDGMTTSAVVAGRNGPGSGMDQLNNPVGIFVDINFDLYVADCGNNRVQLFQLGQIYATTVAGNGATDTITISCPTGVVLDTDNHLFIVDSGNNRIIASGSTGFWCIIGCFGSGSAPNQLNNPRSMSFDSYGNIFVTDRNNQRIQKFLLATNSCDISYNQPKFSPCAIWNFNATTIASSSIIGSTPQALFVNAINTIFMVNGNTSQILVASSEGSFGITRTISSSFSNPKSIFTSVNAEIYVDTGFNRVDSWAWTSNTSATVMNITGDCDGLFIDSNNTLYCSISSLHQVVKISLNDSTETPEVIAGNLSGGSDSFMLNNPRGIFVDLNFDLYVADCGNNRVQRFQPGEFNATTVIGNDSIEDLPLNCPTAVVLDADSNLFIVDNGNSRIIEVTPNNSRCVVGCSGSGSTASQLSHPITLSFDSYGNIFVTDQDNNRIQQFNLITNSCVELITLQTTQASTTTAVESSSHFFAQPTVLSSTFYTTLMKDTTNNPTFTSLQNSTSISSTKASTTSSSAFVPSVCVGQNLIGTNCNISSLPCDMLQPCQNNGTCTNDNTTDYAFLCTCLSGFGGEQCQLNIRPCKPYTCWNNGICNQTSNTTFVCSCPTGWTGIHCETMVNYCDGVNCENNGVCQPLFLNYTCECLGTSFSGRYCEYVSTSIYIHRTVSKSLGYIAAIALVVVVIFVATMDVLKYFFGIDPVRPELERIRRLKALKRKKHKRQPLIAQRYIYVNAPPQRPSTITILDEDPNVTETII